MNNLCVCTLLHDEEEANEERKKNGFLYFHLALF